MHKRSGSGARIQKSVKFFKDPDFESLDSISFSKNLESEPGARIHQKKMADLQHWF